VGRPLRPAHSLGCSVRQLHFRYPVVGETPSFADSSVPVLSVLTYIPISTVCSEKKNEKYIFPPESRLDLLDFLNSKIRAVFLMQKGHRRFLFEDDRRQEPRVTRTGSCGSLDPVDIMQQLRQPAMESDPTLHESLLHWLLQIPRDDLDLRREGARLQTAYTKVCCNFSG